MQALRKPHTRTSPLPPHMLLTVIISCLILGSYAAPPSGGGGGSARDGGHQFGPYGGQVDAEDFGGGGGVHRKEVPMPYRLSLDGGRGQLSWGVESSALDARIHFRLTCNRVHDMFALGFSDRGDVSPADYVISFKNSDGQRVVLDAYAEKHGTLQLDEQQDYEVHKVQELPHKTVVYFSRLVDTCDVNDYTIDEGTTHVLFFHGHLGKGEGRGVTGLNVSHFRPDMQRVQLLKSELPVPPLPSDTQTMVVNVKEVVVPAVDTTYWCSVQMLPRMTKEKYVVKYEGYIAPHGLVHHLEVFHCELDQDARVRPYNDPCGQMAERPAGLSSCRKVIGAWAIGAPSLTYPADVAQPIGGPGYNSYVMVEVHYNNPTLRRGVIDNSGIRFYLTDEVRKYTAGIMEIGQEYTDKVALPSGLPVWKLDGYCTPQCTDVGLPPSGITVFASQLHTHLTGRRAFTKHFRQGVELPELARDDHYSPHYQEIRRLHRLTRILPGDSLVTSCVDRTMDRNNVTLGGFSTRDEMCVNYIHYYPKVQLEVCKSSVTTSSLREFFKLMKICAKEKTSDDLGISDNYKRIKWTPENVQLYKTFIENAPLSVQCNMSDGSRFPGQWEDNLIPKVTFPLPNIINKCDKD